MVLVDEKSYNNQQGTIIERKNVINFSFDISGFLFLFHWKVGNVECLFDMVHSIMLTNQNLAHDALNPMICLC